MIGRSRGGLTCKVHLAADGKGRPRSWVLTAGNINDTMMTAVLEGIRVPLPGKGRPRTRPERVLADKGYPSKANRAWLRERGIAATIPKLPRCGRPCRHTDMATKHLDQTDLALSDYTADGICLTADE
ncbi:transposase [Streptomyces sp. NPDC004629]|uniref:transposase n=1 Tax=Streptomyces sp. NPDC004629 TaxID=3364705 RepID=UPI0036CF65BE